MIEQLRPIFRVLPGALVGYAILLTISNVVELRVSNSPVAIDAGIYSELRVHYLVGLVRCFYDLLWLVGLAAIVAAANKYMNEERN